MKGARDEIQEMKDWVWGEGGNKDHQKEGWNLTTLRVGRGCAVGWIKFFD